MEGAANGLNAFSGTGFLPSSDGRGRGLIGEAARPINEIRLTT